MSKPFPPPAWSKGSHEASCTQEDFLRMGTTHPRLFIPVVEFRLGAPLFAIRLEFEHYRPGTTANDDFQIMRLTWTDARWSVFSIPLRDWDTADTVARQCGMRLANGEPHAVDKGQVTALVSVRHPMGVNQGYTPFPLLGSNVFQLENDHEHPDWKARKSHPVDAARSEAQMIRLIMQRHYDSLPYELAEEPGVDGKPAWIACRQCGHKSHDPADVSARHCPGCGADHLPLKQGAGAKKGTKSADEGGVQ